jgi:hypothetical protein
MTVTVRCMWWGQLRLLVFDVRSVLALDVSFDAAEAETCLMRACVNDGIGGVRGVCGAAAAVHSACLLLWLRLAGCADCGCGCAAAAPALTVSSIPDLESHAPLMSETSSNANSLLVMSV